MDLILINLYMTLLARIYLKHIFIPVLRVFGSPKVDFAQIFDKCNKRNDVVDSERKN